MKSLIAVLWLTAPLRAAEIERPAAPAPSPAPVVAPLSGVSAQLDAALTPGARIETANEALADASTILQGGQAQARAASAVVDAQAAPDSASTSAPLPAPTAKTPSAKAGVPPAKLEAEKTARGERFFAVAGIAVIVAAILAYAALIGGVAQFVQDMEADRQQQLRQADDWGR